MVHAGEHDLVAAPELLSEAARHVQRQAGHVLAKHDLVHAGGIVEVSAGLVGEIDQFPRFHGGGEVTSEIGVAIGEAVHRPVDDLLRHLGPGRVVEVDSVATAVLKGEGRELGADGGDAEGGSHGEKSGSNNGKQPLTGLSPCLNRRFPAWGGRPLAKAPTRPGLL